MSEERSEGHDFAGRRNHPDNPNENPDPYLGGLPISVMHEKLNHRTEALRAEAAKRDRERSEGLAELMRDADAYVAIYRVEYDGGFDDEEDEDGYECAACGNPRGWPYHDAGCEVLMVEEMAAEIRALQAENERLRADRARLDRFFDEVEGVRAWMHRRGMGHTPAYARLESAIQGLASGGPDPEAP